MKLRNMTGIYLSCNGQMLLLYRQGGRVVSDQWVASAGGHFEKDELNDPRACVLRADVASPISSRLTESSRLT